MSEPGEETQGGMPDDVDPLCLESSGRALLELVLLAIIDAYPAEKDRTDVALRMKNREKRLNGVMKHLLGPSSKRGNTRVNDLPALIWMYETYDREAILHFMERSKETSSRPKPGNKTVKILPIAAAAAIKFFPGDRNAKSRIYKKFKKEKDALRERVRSFDATDDLILRRARDICEIIKRTGISVDPPKDIWSGI